MDGGIGRCGPGPRPIIPLSKPRRSASPHRKRRRLASSVALVPLFFANPIASCRASEMPDTAKGMVETNVSGKTMIAIQARSEEHTSELQSHVNLVCRLLLEKKKTNIKINYTI